MLKKGDKVKQIKTNLDEYCRNTTANSELTWEVVKVNKKTYSMKCVDGYMKNCECNLNKEFYEKGGTFRDLYFGTVTRWVRA